MNLRALTVILIAFLILSCGRNKTRHPAVNEGRHIATAPSERSGKSNAAKTQSAPLSHSAMILDSLGYVNVRENDPRIDVEIIYATADNFTGEILYEDLTEAYLLPEAAQKLSKAQDLLSRENKNYRLLVYDAARPMSVQREMWKVAVQQNKQYYVANPAKGGGLHNYGAAVDVTIINRDGIPLPMGTGYDFLGPEANTDKEKELLRSGKITEEELENRLLLRKVMKNAGFRTVASEWWHFNLCSREEAIRKYPLIDF